MNWNITFNGETIVLCPADNALSFALKECLAKTWGLHPISREWAQEIMMQSILTLRGNDITAIAYMDFNKHIVIIAVK